MQKDEFVNNLGKIYGCSIFHMREIQGNVSEGGHKIYL